MLINLIKSLISGDMTAIVYILFVVVIVIFSLTVHECAHGICAYALGDRTAKNMGRLTLNPLAHLDPIGALMMLLFGFGWAKPVPINPANFKNRKGGMALTALAGPISNLLMSALGVLINHIVYTVMYANNSVNSGLSVAVCEFLYLFYYLNATLAIFNLIPIPPLDGSRILNIILPEKYYFKIMQYERYIYLAVVILLFTGLLNTPLSFLVNGYLNGISSLVSMIPGIM